MQGGESPLVFFVKNMDLYSDYQNKRLHLRLVVNKLFGGEIMFLKDS